ncbi:MAG: GNAT family N-acetyltransferase [Qipengyuania sp.]
MLRPFDTDDITEAYIGWLNDPEVTRFSNLRFRRHNRATCESYLDRFANPDNLFICVRAAVDDRAIGTMTVYRSAHHGTCDMGILIGERSYWGAGYGQEAWNLLACWLLDVAGMRKLTAGCLAPNRGMVRVMERSGMHREAVRERQEVVEGRPEDVLLYARFAD